MSTTIEAMISKTAEQVAMYTKDTAAYINDIREKMLSADFLSPHCKAILESVLKRIEKLNSVNMNESERDQVLAELRRMLGAIDRGRGENSPFASRRTETPQVTIYEVCGRLETSLFPFAELANDATMIQAMDLIIKKKAALLKALNAIADLAQSNPRNFGTEEKYAPFLKALRSFGVSHYYNAEKKISHFSEGEGQQSVWTDLARPEQPNIVNLELPPAGHIWFDDAREQQETELASAVQNFNLAIGASAPHIRHTMQKMREAKMFANLGVVCGALAGLDQKNAGVWYQLASEMKGIIQAYADKQQSYERRDVIQEQIAAAVNHLEAIRVSLETARKESNKDNHKILIDNMVAFIEFRFSLENMTRDRSMQENFYKIKDKITQMLAVVKSSRDAELLIGVEDHLLALSTQPQLTVDFLQNKLNAVTQEKNMFDLYAYQFENKNLGEIVKQLLSYPESKEKQFIEDYLIQLAAWCGIGDAPLSLWDKEFVSPLNELLKAYQNSQNSLGKLNAITKLLLVHHFGFQGYILRELDSEVNQLADIGEKISEIHTIAPFSDGELVKINEAVQAVLSDIPVTQDKMESLIKTLQEIYQEHANTVAARLKEEIAASKKESQSLTEQLASLKEKQTVLKKNLKDLVTKEAAEEKEQEEAKQASEKAGSELSAAEQQLVKSTQAQKEAQERRQQAIEDLDVDIKADEQEFTSKSVEYSKLANANSDYLKNKRVLEEELSELGDQITEIEKAIILKKKEEDLAVANLALAKSEGDLEAATEKLKEKEQFIANNLSGLSTLPDKATQGNVVKAIITGIDAIIAKHPYLNHAYSGIGNIIGRKQADRDLAKAFEDFKKAVTKEGLTDIGFNVALKDLQQAVEAALLKDLSKERRGTLNAFLNSLDGKKRLIEHARVKQFENTSLKNMELHNAVLLRKHIDRALPIQKQHKAALEAGVKTALEGKEAKQAAVDLAKKERDQYAAQIQSQGPFSNMSVEGLKAKEKELQNKKSATQGKLDSLGINDGGIAKLESVKADLETTQKRIESLKQQRDELLSSPSQDMGVVSAEQAVLLAEQAVVTVQSEGARIQESLHNTQEQKQALIGQQSEIEVEVKSLESQLAALHRQEAELRTKLQKLPETRTQEIVVNAPTVPTATEVKVLPQQSEASTAKVDDSVKKAAESVVSKDEARKSKEGDVSDVTPTTRNLLKRLATRKKEPVHKKGTRIASIAPATAMADYSGSFHNQPTSGCQKQAQAISDKVSPMVSNRLGV